MFSQSPLCCLRKPWICFFIWLEDTNLYSSCSSSDSLSVVPSPSRPALTLFHNLRVDVVDVGESMSTMSANRRRRCRFWGYSCELFAGHVLQKLSFLRIFAWQNKDDQFGNHFNVSSAISWPLISFRVKFAIFTIHIIHKRLCCQLSTFIITLFHPVLFHITHGDGWGLVLINSAAPRLLAHSCWGVSPIQVLVSHPYTQRHLTHTPNGVSLIELSMFYAWKSETITICVAFVGNWAQSSHFVFPNVCTVRMSFHAPSA